MSIQTRTGTNGRKTYRVERMLDGVRVSKTFKTKLEAKEFDGLLTVDKRFSGTILDRTKNKLTFDEAAEKYLQSAEFKELRDPTIPRRLGYWMKRFKDRQLVSITTDDIDHALNDMEEDGLSGATLNRYRVQLSTLYSWLIRRKHTKENPATASYRRKESKPYDKFLTKDEAARLLDACLDSRWDRLYLLVLMAISTGGRKGELINLRWCDIDFDRCKAYLPNTKNGKVRYLKLTPEVIEELRRFRGIGEAFVFTNEAVNPYRPWVHFDQTWRVARKAAGVDIKFHGLRHTCASWLAMDGHSLQIVGKILGHSSPAMTDRYSHLSDECEQIAVNGSFGSIGRRATA
ncbi:tyrosine-type recombinase/integrase [Aeromonas media]|uniref:tyrosine-type recombinase/integrase n=1 Tax=Aeromonas media TaxID=651 RepID=UPI001119D1FA|nr:site-specific integrase [Aeromonas media]